MRIVVDIDGTICNLTNGQYDQCKPFVGAIEYLNLLSDRGDSIIYFTGRGWDKYEMTYRQLRSWGCKFDQLICGKPLGDVYIDDLSIDSVIKYKDKQYD